jgi:ATP-dependent DNA helicase PIF1
MISDGIEITEEFSKALSLIQASRQNLFIAGRAGTGKSTLLGIIKKAARGKLVVLAPTGLAAINVGGQTIHSFFKFPPRLIRTDNTRFGRQAALYRSLDTLIIDEISMVRADLMEGIDRSLRLNRGRLNEPFGGVRVILIGDIHQLSPVVAESEVQQYLQDEFGGVYFFNAKVFRECQPRYLELTKKFRQSDEDFGKILDRVADGFASGEQLKVFNNNVISFDALPDRDKYTILAPHNHTVFDLNMRFLDALGGKEWAAEALVTGSFEESRLTRSSTTAGSASVEVSPRLPGSSSAILRRMRRMILPERVLGRPGRELDLVGRGDRADLLAHPATSSLRSASLGSTRSSASHRRRCPGP